MGQISKNLMQSLSQNKSVFLFSKTWKIEKKIENLPSKSSKNNSKKISFESQTSQRNRKSPPIANFAAWFGYINSLYQKEKRRKTKRKLIQAEISLRIM